MKREIAKNEYYEIYVDEEINRVHWLLRGRWDKPSDLPDYVRHNREALGLLRPGFTAVVDLRDMGIPGVEMLALITEMSKEAEEAGQGRQAQIVNREFLEGTRASRDVIKESGMDLKMMQFGNYEEAIEWLDG